MFAPLPHIAAFALAAGAAHAQFYTVDPAITFQGRLERDGAPVDGSTTFRARIFDGPSESAAMLAELPPITAVVEDGAFTLELDFDPALFGGQDRWLHVMVLDSAGGGFVPLQPRLRLAPTPYAIRAASTPYAEYAANTRNLLVTDGGDVGVGFGPSPAQPQATLHVAGPTGIAIGDTPQATDLARIRSNAPLGALRPGASTTGTIISGRPLVHTVIDVTANDPGDSFAVRTDADMNGEVDTIAMAIKPSGRVGVGTTEPQAELDVAGVVRVEALRFADGTEMTTSMRPVIRATVSLDLPPVPGNAGGYTDLEVPGAEVGDVVVMTPDLDPLWMDQRPPRIVEPNRVRFTWLNTSSLTQDPPPMTWQIAIIK